MNKEYDVLSIGTMYVDIDFLAFPFIDSLSAHKETVGREYELGPGGSALTFARICALTGLKPIFIGKTGQDEMGKVLKELFEKSNIKPAIVNSPKVSTNVAVHYVRKDGVSIMTSAGTANRSISIEDIREQFETNISLVRYLYLGGAFKMKTLLPYYLELVDKAKKHNVKVVLDHGRVNNSVTEENIELIHQLVKDVDVYLPSKDEFLETWHVDTIDAGFKAVRKISPTTIVVKNSENGASAIEGSRTYQVPAIPVHVLNSVGAGDSFNAGYIRGLVEGKKVLDCMRLACATAAAKISSMEPINQQKVRSFLEKII